MSHIELKQHSLRILNLLFCRFIHGAARVKGVVQNHIYCYLRSNKIGHVKHEMARGELISLERFSQTHLYLLIIIISFKTNSLNAFKFILRIC